MGFHSTLQNGVTALHLASFKGHHKVVELLLGAWANPNLRDKVKQYSGVHTEINSGVKVLLSFAVHKIYCNSQIFICISLHKVSTIDYTVAN